VNACMYVCMYVYMYVHMYVCMYMGMYVHTYVHMYVVRNGSIHSVVLSQISHISITLFYKA
jgi:hypothetical protein